MNLALEKEPTNVEMKVLKADLMMETGDKAAAQEILNSVDLTKVKDPFPFINSAIVTINAGKGDEAAEALTKLLAQFPTQTGDLLLPRPRIRRRQEVRRGEGGPRKVRLAVADGERSGRCEAHPRPAAQEVAGGEGLRRPGLCEPAGIRLRRIQRVSVGHSRPTSRRRQPLLDRSVDG